jgi:hypothetical protein
MAEGKSPAIRRLLEALSTAYGTDAFPVEDWRPGSPDAIGLTSTRDRRFAASVIALPDEPNRYSVVVELYDPPEPTIIGFEIAANGEFSLAGVVELLDHYREWSRD